jgi:hypothetical protein
MKKSFLPVAGVLLLSLCLLNREEATRAAETGIVFHQQPDTSDTGNPVTLYYHGNNSSVSNNSDHVYR